MRKLFSLLLPAALGVAIAPPAGFAWEHHAKACCDTGYTVVQEICYQEVCKKVCRVVPDVKKTTKWVYNYKCEDFCVPKCTVHGLVRHHGCQQCAACLHCDKPMTKKWLVKRMVVEECPTEKCVVETIVERVPYVVYRKVPCGTPAPCVTPEVVPAPKTTVPLAATNSVPAFPGILPVGPAAVTTIVEVTPPAPPLTTDALPVVPSPSIPLGR